MKTVAIIGVGLIGGSFGLALRRAGFDGTILGVSRPDVIASALKAGAIDSGAELAEAVAQANLIYLSQSIGRIIEIVPKLRGLLQADALVTDVGSTKATIVATAAASIPSCQFLGGHPLAGKESRGVETATADLFSGRTYVLTPLHHSDLTTPAARRFTGWLAKIGAKTIVMDPEEHDRTLALTSHLPQLASTALAVLLRRSGSRVQEAFGPALVDSTRLALSSYDIWNDILLTNHSKVECALDAYIATLQELRSSLKTARLSELFKDGAEFASEIRRK